MTLADQIAEAVRLAGGQAALVHLVREAGGGLTQPTLSGLVRGHRPDVETLWAIARVTGCAFRIDKDTKIGESRRPRPSDARPKKKTIRA